jgi:pyruvate/2-oxoglutarate dehydrogenase complex dihydrolipoamide dehydrogenase (E3) component
MLGYQAIIIGTGQAGPALPRRLVAAGWKVAIIERKLFGGTCVNTGCTPTKTLVASAYAAHVARRAADYGVNIGGRVTVDMKAVKARKDAVVRPSRNGVERSLKTLNDCTVYEGHARFVGSKEVKVGDEVLKADKVFINVGGRALVPPIPGLDQIPYLTNSSMMDVDFLPARLVVLGGSYVGLEFAQAYRRFGSEVTMIELASHLISREDEDVSQAVAEFLKEEGIDIRVDTKVLRLEKQGSNIVVAVETGGKESQASGPIYCWLSADGPTPTISASMQRASPPTSMATSRLTVSYAPMCPGSGPWAIATAAAPLPIPPGTITRSLRATSWTTIHGASRIALRLTRYIPIPRSAAPA